MNKPKNNPIAVALDKSRKAFWGVGLFSCAINILMLTGPLFMLQIYDRVLVSGSVPTLVALSVLVGSLYLFQGFFEFLRSKILMRIGYHLDVETMRITNKTWLLSEVNLNSKMQKPVQDLTIVRKFIGGKGLPALFDIPWVPFYLGIVFLLHIWLGWLVTAGLVIVLTLTLINEFTTKKHIASATQAEMEEANFSESSSRGSETIISMGMIGSITDQWQKMRFKSMATGQTATNRTSRITSFVKAFRLALQSGILAVGAYLTIFQEITAGTMIAASILGGRALGPVDMAIANWPNFVKARQSLARLKECLSGAGDLDDLIELPPPKGNLVLDEVTKMAAPAMPGADRHPIIQQISFQLDPGDGLGVIGPSGSGKSSLARLIVGLWEAERGEVRLDCANYKQWDRERLGRYIGYLPQSVELFPGSIKDNIARFDPDVSDEEVIEAAKLTSIHELITGFPNGYSTQLGSRYTVLTAGQAQRVALARAVLRMPTLVVLDEPNSNLDAEGDTALTNTIQALRENASTVVVMAHRPSAISAVNKLLVLKGGMLVEFGEKSEVLEKITQAPDPAQNVRQLT
ncbi:MAG: type I secretion system permease/ATPase [Hyphomicrobiales bacterium]|nr:type I secretion system permease/ATPase [Hyphomicrobiales bacterium]